MVWRTLATTSGLIARGAMATSRSMSGAVQRTAFASRGHAARGGILPPGAPDPAPGSGDFYDYRGVARPQGVAALHHGAHRLGGAVDLRTAKRVPIGLPDYVLARHAAVVGPSGSGKTGMLLVPWGAVVPGRRALGRDDRHR